jgi:hypothetical protein
MIPLLLIVVLVIMLGKKPKNTVLALRRLCTKTIAEIAYWEPLRRYCRADILPKVDAA